MTTCGCCIWDFLFFLFLLLFTRHTIPAATTGMSINAAPSTPPVIATVWVALLPLGGDTVGNAVATVVTVVILAGVAAYYMHGEQWDFG